MTAVVSFDRDEVSPAQIGTPGSDRDQPKSAAYRSLRWCWVPAIISVTVNTIFLVVWWLPEYSTFPGHDAILTQLWPLASKELITGNEAVVAAQTGRSGLLPALLLITSILLPFLARGRQWPVRIVVPMASVYVGLVTWVVTLLGLLARDELARSWIGMVLLSAWVITAGITAWRSLRVQPEVLPGRPTRVFFVVVLIALLYPVPIALGRRIFAPDVTEAARSLIDADATLRIAALNDGATVALYLSGMSVVLTAWACYMIVPPLSPIAVPWVRRSRRQADPLFPRLLILLLCVTGLVFSASSAVQLGRARAVQVQTGSPASDLVICATWSQSRPGQPSKSLVARGYQCRSLVSYVGYNQVASGEVANSMSPIRAETPDDRKINTKVVSAQYGSVVVLATSTRLDLAPDQLTAVDFSTTRQLWSFRCDDDEAMKLRFAGADGGDLATAGRITESGEKPSVLVACSNRSVRLDPETGKRAQ
jgi:hypothetical protein